MMVFTPSDTLRKYNPFLKLDRSTKCFLDSVIGSDNNKLPKMPNISSWVKLSGAYSRTIVLLDGCETNIRNDFYCGNFNEQGFVFLASMPVLFCQSFCQ